MSNDTLGEFAQIAKIMAPLAQKAKGAFALTDDAAVFQCPVDHEIVVTTDTLVAGIHFFPQDSSTDIAYKLLGVNLSDLAAMGAKPLHYTLNASYPAEITREWISGFAKGLQEVQDQSDIVLLGGDTTRTTGPLTLSLTAFGIVPKGKALRRNSAREGDLICVSGTMGDSALGLQVCLGKLKDETNHLKTRYHRPEPKNRLGQNLIGIATSCMDISDGLLADLQHICTQSNLGAELNINDIPLSIAAHNCLKKDSSLIRTILTGGDDYELLFSIAPQDKEQLVEISKKSQTNIQVIGSFTGQSGIRLYPENQHLTQLNQLGYRHF